MNEEVMAKMSAGPYQWAIIKDGPQQQDFIRKYFARGNGDVHAVWLPDHPQTIGGADPTSPEHAVLMCMTGNGPNSMNNAHAIMCILTQRDEAIKTRQKMRLPIPTTPDAVAWSEYAIYLENALAIADPIPETLAKKTVDDLMRPRSPHSEAQPGHGPLI